MKNQMKKWLVCLSAVLILFTPVGADSLAIKTNAAKPETVCVGGMPFGVKFFSQGIIIVGFTEIETESGVETPAYDAGLRVNDVITRVNGEPVRNSIELMNIVEAADDAIEITYVRGGDENTVTFLPSLCASDGKRKTGMWIRDTTAGIGTVTYIKPETGEFAGLGHGICDSESGELLKMERGTVVKVQISGITKGISGTPGELKGYFSSEKSGVLLGNTLCGVYGVFADLPENMIEDAETEVGTRDEVKEGEATIWCTLDDNMPHEYCIMIDCINRDSRDNRSFSITVTDPELIEKTGGIVQGMSGSPIMQNGKLIGAVTHVLVGDPTRGYGIFIENMLDAAG